MKDFHGLFQEEGMAQTVPSSLRRQAARRFLRH